MQIISKSYYAHLIKIKQEVLSNFSRLFTPCSLGFSSLLYFVSLLHSAKVHRAMYADGSFFFVSALVNGFSDDGKHQRLFINLINQFPMNFARFLGLDGYTELGYLFDGSVFVLPFLLVLIALYILVIRRLFGQALVIFIMFVVFVIPSSIFIINPAIVFFGLLTLIVATTMIYDSSNKIRIALFCFAFLLFRSHETVLLLMPFFIAHSILKYFKTKDLFLLILTVVYVCVFIYSIWWGVSHPVSTQTSGYTSLVFQIISQIRYYLSKTNLLFSFFGFLAASIIVVNRLIYPFWKKKLRWIFFELLIPILITIIFTIHFFFMLLKNGQWPTSEFDLRVLITIGAILLTSTIFIPKKFFASYVYSPSVIFILSVTLFFHSIWQISHNVRWNLFYKSSADQISSMDKSRRIDLGNIEENRYEWLWTWPVFSVVIQHGQARVLALPDKPTELDSKILFPRDENDTVSIPFSVWKQGKFFTVKEYIDD